jgi:hypothetical protein
VISGAPQDALLGGIQITRFGTAPNGRRGNEPASAQIGGCVCGPVVRERDCPETAGRCDHIVEATLIGTAIARFARAGQHHDRAAQAIMPLGPQRRQPARIRIQLSVTPCGSSLLSGFLGSKAVR